MVVYFVTLCHEGSGGCLDSLLKIVALRGEQIWFVGQSRCTSCTVPQRAQRRGTEPLAKQAGLRHYVKHFCSLMPIAAVEMPGE